MAAVRSKNTSPELLLRHALFAQGFRYRVAVRDVTGTPDIVFPRIKLAVFVDGDFWHGNAWRQRGDASNDEMLRRWRNSDFWRAKIAANVARDRRVDNRLRESGWIVLRLWESEITVDLNGTVNRIVRSVAEAAKRADPAQRGSTAAER